MNERLQKSPLGYLIVLGVLCLLITNMFLLERMNTMINSFRSIQGQVIEPLASGISAPNFVSTDQFGNEVSLASYNNKPILLAFMSLSCPYCDELYPHLQQFYEINGREIPVIMFSLGSEEGTYDLVERENLTFSVLEWNEEITSNYTVPGTPFIYVLNSNHVIETSGFATDREQLDAILQ